MRFEFRGIRRLLGLVALLVSADALAATPSPLREAIAGNQLSGLQWRLLGPFRGGWGTMARGIAEQPDTFYFGAAGGGVWKTDNAGATWQSMSDGLDDAAIGAIAIAPSNPQVLYVGSGHPEPRYDIQSGNGVYRSSDGGAHWQHAGLQATKYIGDILVDARNPDTVLVAALGHVFGPSRDRGVFRSSDGGNSWTKTLFVDEDTGVVDLAADPAQPNLVFAAAWTARNWPWLSYFTPIVGAGSAIYRSSDGGVSWRKLGGAGWPGGNLGRIGLAVTHLKSGATRVYASIDAEKDGGLYRSDDGGAHWQRVNDAKAVSTWYMSRLTVAPEDADTLYTVGQSIHKSTDAGKTFTIIKGAPGGDDYHDLWINPQHPDHLITASDQGTVVSVDGGAHWSDWYNQPTGQFYHLATDNRFPYWVYSGQQDSGTVGIASRSDYGAISFRDWHPVGGDERDYDLPDPDDPGIVYGSGLGGRISRWDSRTGEVQNVSPWPVSSYGARGTDVRYRYTWFTPIAFSAQAPHALYSGAQVLFRSLDKGQHWQAISPDLTGQRDAAKHCDGDVPIAHAGACGYGVIYSIAPSPRDNDEIWIGTDNGRIQLTRDAGKNWSDITPKSVPDWARIDSLDVSALDPGTAYAAVDNHRQDDFRPHALVTHDYGKHWTDIANGLVDGHYISVVRADPQRRGLLYAGTDAGVFVSFDDGGHWQSLQRNLPVAWVRDLLIHDNDLIAATQGRAIWVLDDVSPLRQLDTNIAHAEAHLFAPAPAYRVRADQNKDTPPPADTPLGKNPPNGAIIDYTLAHDAQRVVVDIRDGAGHSVRHFDSNAPEPQPLAERYFAQAWTQAPATPGKSAGAHRFVWDLRLARPKAVQYGYSIAAVLGDDMPITPEGPLALPGNYETTLSVDGHEFKQPLVIKPDPRVSVSSADLEQALHFSQAIEKDLGRVWQAYGEVDAVHKQLDALAQAGGAAAQSPVKNAIGAFAARLKPLREGDGEAAPNFGAIDGVLASLATDVEGADRAPTAPQQAVLADYRGRLDQALAMWQALRDAELTRLNARLQQAALPVLHVPSADEIGVDIVPESKDLP